MSYFLNNNHYTFENAILWGNCSLHAKKVQTETALKSKCFHGLIVALETPPFLSQLISLVELCVFKLFFSFQEANLEHDSPSPLNKPSLSERDSLPENLHSDTVNPNPIQPENIGSPEKLRLNLQTLTHNGFYWHNTARDNPDTLFFFGENLKTQRLHFNQNTFRYESKSAQNGTQAIIRAKEAKEHPNVCGIVSCKKPSQPWLSSEIQEAKKAIDLSFKIAEQMLLQGKFKQLAIPDGIGSGVAQLNSNLSLYEIHKHLNIRIDQFKAFCTGSC